MTPERWRRITGMFHAARARELGTRAAFLEQECGSDQVLRAEVDALLVAYEEAGSFGDTALVPGSGESMSLIAGTCLGPYKILSAIGAGGMGEVYRARDTRLGRDVALKILPPLAALDADRRARFEQEARAASALNHPNIVSVLDIGEASGIAFLVMEYVDGKTLREVLEAGDVPLRKQLDVACQIADGLAKAHAAGIVHRDLKPENVMVSTDGFVKILDFGVSKLTAPDVGALTTAPRLTVTGMLVGTIGYVSPEQASGRPADFRSDQFAFGIVLYEMVAGRRPFERPTAAETLAAVIRDDPDDVARLNPRVPVPLTWILKRCLAKDPEERYAATRDLARDLATLRDHSHEWTAPVAAPAQPLERSWRPTWLWAAGAATMTLLAGALSLVWSPSRRSEPIGPPRAEFVQITSHPGVEWFPSLSPDGKWVVYSGSVTGRRHIYLQSVSGQNALDLTPDSPGDDDQPAFSPDGERIAFRSSRDGGGIFVMGRTGEAVTRMTRMGFKPTWSPDGAYLAFTSENVDLNPQNSQGQSELWTVNVKTGQTRRLTAEDAVLASWSPHNHRIAFTRRLGSAQDARRGGVWTILPTGGAATQVTTGDSRDWNPVWSPDGRHLYFSSDRGGTMNLWRVGIDEQSGVAQGQPEPVVTPAPFLAHASISADGTRIAYTSAVMSANVQRVAMDPRTGDITAEPEWLTTGSRRWSMPDPSVDGEWVAFYTLTQPEGHLYVARRDGTGLRRVTGDAVDRMPRWSPDGQWIACFSNRAGSLELWKIRPDGSDLQRLTEGGGSYFAWSPDGSRIAVLRSVEQLGGSHVAILDPHKPWKEQTPERLPALNPPSARFQVSSWSPDGERLAAEVDAGMYGIVTYSLRSRRYERLTDFGQWPVWLPDSRRVMFVAEGRSFFLVDAITKEVRRVFSVDRDVIGPPRLTRDGKTVYYSRRITEGDIWILQLK
jgi:Tol biopolymer transport system component/predicted Ser/Thr protein kinase